MNSKKINKIYLKIDAIVKKGEMGRVEYYQYVNDLIDKGEYYFFQEVMLRKYKIDTVYIETYNVKKKTYDLLRPITISKFQEDLKKMYDTKLVYQIGMKIYYYDNLFLGSIVEDMSSTIHTLIVYRQDGLSAVFDDSTTTLLVKYGSAIDFLILYTTQYVDVDYMDYDYVV